METLKRLFVVSLVFLVACGPAGSRRPLPDSRSQWTEELAADSKEGSVIRAAWELKEKLKRDYTEFIGPPATFNEMLDLKFTIAVDEMMLEFPAYYESVARKWARSATTPPPTREELFVALKMLRRNAALLEEEVARTMEAAEKAATEDTPKKEQVFRIIAGVVLLTLAVTAWKTEILAITPPYKYIHGNYVIYRHGSEVIVTSPSERTYYCHTIGGQTVADVVCN